MWRCDDTTNDCRNRRVAERLDTWVCNSNYGAADGDDDLRLTDVTNGEGFIVLEPTGEPCLFHVAHEDALGVRTRLSEDPSGYLIAAAAESNGERIACVSRLDHIAADDQGRPDPDGQLFMRETTGVSIQCARYDGNEWGVLHTAIQQTQGPAGCSRDWAPTGRIFAEMSGTFSSLT